MAKLVVSMILHRVEFVVFPLKCQQLAMGSLFHHPAIRENDDSICFFDGGKSVGNNEGSSSFHQFFQSYLYLSLCLIVQRGSGFIQNKNRSILEKSSSNSNPLFLTTRKLNPSLPYDAIITLGIIYNKLVSISCFCCCYDFAIRFFQTSVGYVIFNGVIKKNDFLRYHAELVS